MLEFKNHYAFLSLRCVFIFANSVYPDVMLHLANLHFRQNLSFLPCVYSYFSVDFIYRYPFYYLYSFLLSLSLLIDSSFLFNTLQFGWFIL